VSGSLLYRCQLHFAARDRGEPSSALMRPQAYPLIRSPRPGRQRASSPLNEAAVTAQNTVAFPVTESACVGAAFPSQAVCWCCPSGGWWVSGPLPYRCHHFAARDRGEPRSSRATTNVPVDTFPASVSGHRLPPRTRRSHRSRHTVVLPVTANACVGAAFPYPEPRVALSQWRLVGVRTLPTVANQHFAARDWREPSSRATTNVPVDTFLHPERSPRFPPRNKAAEMFPLAVMLTVLTVRACQCVEGGRNVRCPSGYAARPPP
jgi:hypothetical protein